MTRHFFTTMKTILHLIALCAGLCAWGILATPARANVPPVTFTVKPLEPDENGSLVYARIAADSGDQSATNRFWISATATNNGGATLHLNKIQLTFIAGNTITLRIFPRSGADGELKTTGARTFELTADEVVTLPQPVPNSVVVSLFFDTYTEPVSVQQYSLC